MGQHIKFGRVAIDILFKEGNDVGKIESGLIGDTQVDRNEMNKRHVLTRTIHLDVEQLDR